MRILNIPGPEKPNRKDRWFADSLQFAPENKKLWLRAEILGTVTTGLLELATGGWSKVCAFNGLSGDEVPPDLAPLKPWSPDFSRVVSYVGESPSQDRDMVSVDETDYLLGISGWVMRTIESNETTDMLSGLVWSPDGRWLYIAEHSDYYRDNVSTSIARADVRALFKKRGTKRHGVNPLTRQPFTHREVPPATFEEVVPLSQGGRVKTAVSPDGRLLAVGTNTGDTHLIRVRGGVTRGDLNRKRGKRTDNVSVRRIEFSPSGKELGVVVDGMLRVWDVKTAKLLWAAEDAKANVVDVAYHPAGNTIAVARSDGDAVFLDATSGTEKMRYAWKVGQLNSVAFSPDGLTCAAGGEKGQVVVWDVDA